MKKRIAIFALSLTLFSPEISWALEDCQSGGVGSTSCSVSKTFAVQAGPAGGTTTITYETTCGTGYYSCCNIDIWSGEGSASCISAPGLE
ncbi:hypothetical protein [Algoriphagus aquimarinus]|uniref:Uncharacterized protein n=1 Tax=Algoriphagus aquimarinus TaxID=237018 RepID=A0A1I0VAA3_9BACT|nr:hypothetical protein [Algoriphagus aquimarinus]SFA73162.1 hypothetical protein SAMN04489723_10190 [Algoriphagus aquimarinus]|tara:strand:- start:66451 stop:66720 length:270 start_codon:yes stop_codon:yes gene_type:complete